MNLDRNRIPQPFLDEDAQECVLVPLANRGGLAVLHAEELQELLDAGLSGLWSFNKAGERQFGYVRARVPGSPLQTIARLIAKAGPREQVRYRDGNPRNLRGSNLVVTAGGVAKTDCAALLATAEEAAAERLAA